jgi:hypothetical protein
LQERFRGWTLIATSEDEPGTVRVPFSFDLLKPECRIPVARAITKIIKSLARQTADEEKGEGAAEKEGGDGRRSKGRVKR